VRKLWLGAGVAALVLAFGVATVATAGDGGRHKRGDGDRHGGKSGLKAKLKGANEVPSTSTVARGRFKAEIRGEEIHYTLSYSGLEDKVRFAHIHFAQEDVNGAVVAFLCGGGGKPACPQSGEVSGVITPADVMDTSGPPQQGIAAGEFGEFVAAIRRELTYANVHSDKFPQGEIRGQIEGGDEDDD
jgi:hypothetical protein